MKQIPNLITLLNLLCGCAAIIEILASRPENAGVLILFSLFFDFADGFSARLLGAYSEIGKQLDSLADVVSFGVVPGMILFSIFRESSAANSLLNQGLPFADFYPYLMFIVTLFSALRLAKFNIDTRQTQSFIGLPTPANTILIASFVFILKNDEFGIGSFLQNPWFLLVFAMLSSWLLVAEIPLFSLKFKNLKFIDNKGPFLLLIFSIPCILLLHYAAAPAIITFYVILSLIYPPSTVTS